MRARSLIILLLSLGVAMGATALVVHWQASKPTRTVLGSRLFAGLPVNEVAFLTIKSGDNAVLLARKESGWVVQERFNYPADFGRITNLIRKLKEAQVGRQFEGSEQTLKRLALKDPDDPKAAEKEKGTRLVLKDQRQKVLASVLLGSERQRAPNVRGSGGRYLRLGESTKVYLIDEHLRLAQGGAADWLERQLLQVDPAELKRISGATADGKRVLYSFQRSGPGKELEAVDMVVYGKIKEQELKRVAGALRSLRLIDVVERQVAPTLDGFPFRLEYELFGGMTYRIYPSAGCSKSSEDQCLLRLEAGYQELPAEKDDESVEEVGAEEKSETEKTPEELAAEARSLNERLSPWVYRVPWSQHYALITDPTRFLEKEKKKGSK
jgi:hypothetical protein